MPIFELNDYSFTYAAGNAPALNAVTLGVEEGEFLAVIGADNAGKSTLCYALTGVVPHLHKGTVQGSIRVCDEDTQTAGVGGLTRSVALVMQNPSHQLSGVRFTVREEIAFGLENQGVPVKELRERVEKIITDSGLTEIADASPHTLSGGQLQQMTLAAALAGDTPALVLDQPTASLDPLAAQTFFERLGELSRSGKTIVLAEQRLDLIALHANRVIALDKGRVVLDGPPEKVLISPLLPQIGLDWTRYTKVADLARRQHLWSVDTPLSTTLDDTIDGLTYGEDA